MSLPFKVDKEQVEQARKFIINYPTYAVVIVLCVVIGYQNIILIPQKDEKIEKLLTERAEKAEKTVDKQSEIIQYWRDLGKQIADLNEITSKKDTLKR